MGDTSPLINRQGKLEKNSLYFRLIPNRDEEGCVVPIF